MEWAGVVVPEPWWLFGSDPFPAGNVAGSLYGNGDRMVWEMRRMLKEEEKDGDAHQCSSYAWKNWADAADGGRRRFLFPRRH